MSHLNSVPSFQRIQAFSLRYLIALILINAVILISTSDCSPVTSQHRVRHEFHKKSKRNVNLMNEIRNLSYNSSEKDIKINISESISISREDLNENNKIFSPGQNREPPTYLTFVYESLASDDPSTMELSVHSESKEDNKKHQGFHKNEWLVQAILPNQITTSKKLTVIKLPIAKHGINEFSKANFILTMKDDINIADDDEITVNILIKSTLSFQVKHSLTIREESKFYSFDITNALQNELMVKTKNKMDPEERSSLLKNQQIIVEVECTITMHMAKRKLGFHEIFNTEEDAPFILRRFHKVLLPSPASFALVQSNSDYFASVKNQKWNLKPRENTLERRKRSNPAETTNHAISIPQIAFDMTRQESSPHPQVLMIQRNDDWPASTSQTIPTSTDTVSFDLTSSTTNSLPGSVETDYERPVTIETPTSEATEISKPMKKAPPYPHTAPTNPAICRRYDWLVKPSELSLDNVHSPSLLDLGYCAGTCPFPLENDLYNFTLHSYLVDQYRFYNGFETPMNIRPSHCIPVSYKPLMVLAREEDGGYAVVILEDASVSACGCR